MSRFGSQVVSVGQTGCVRFRHSIKKVVTFSVRFALKPSRFLDLEGTQVGTPHLGLAVRHLHMMHFVALPLSLGGIFRAGFSLFGANGLVGRVGCRVFGIADACSASRGHCAAG